MFCFNWFHDKFNTLEAILFDDFKRICKRLRQCLRGMRSENSVKSKVLPEKTSRFPLQERRRVQKFQFIRHKLYTKTWKAVKTKQRGCLNVTRPNRPTKPLYKSTNHQKSTFNSILRLPLSQHTQPIYF